MCDMPEPYVYIRFEADIVDILTFSMFHTLFIWRLLSNMSAVAMGTTTLSVRKYSICGRKARGTMRTCFDLTHIALGSCLRVAGMEYILQPKSSAGNRTARRCVHSLLICARLEMDLLKLGNVAPIAYESLVSKMAGSPLLVLRSWSVFFVANK